MLLENAGTDEVGFLDDIVPEIASQLSWGALESKERVEDELDICMRTIRTFWEMEPDQVARLISAMSARMTEMGVHLHRVEHHREWRRVRTMQVERILQELDRQWKIASRNVAIRQQDLDMSK